VAAGKTTTARVLAELLRRGPDRPAVDLLATDSFLLPNQALASRGLLGRKGFPETYDHRALAAAVEAVRAGQPEVAIPVYRHTAYDIVPGEVQRIRRPDLLLVEGLAVLREAPGDEGSESAGGAGGRALVDLAVYIDADEEALLHWHTERLLALRAGGDDAGGGSSDFLHWLRSLSDDEAVGVATSSWSEINLVNLRDHVAPTRLRADVILEKDDHHRVLRVLVRRPPEALGAV
jgi:type I pantothenate kinase